MLDKEALLKWLDERQTEVSNSLQKARDENSKSNFNYNLGIGIGLQMVEVFIKQADEKDRQESRQ